jgi:arylsulfatase A-like enzyme
MKLDVVTILLLLQLSLILLLAAAHSSNNDDEDDDDDQQQLLPNIVILFADNLGYDDVSFFQSSATKATNAKATTPNIDRLGMEGIQFLNWNSVAALCSASRATLLTGKYPVRTGTYPRVFRPSAKFGLLPNETTIAELLQAEGYATSIVGKWHLGHRPQYLPTNQGFEEWTGIPYHMSGGSVDGHVCNSDKEGTMWLPLYQNNTIVEQPVNLETLAETYANSAVRFIQRNRRRKFFLYMAFSHVHQLCAPRDYPEQTTCQWSSTRNATFQTAVEEMDWIAGQILDALDETGVASNTLVIFTSDNGPWVAEQSCSGSKGPFKGDWLRRYVDESCTACPHDYIPQPTADNPRRCVLPGPENNAHNRFEVDGVHCGEDVGLGSVWEANMRMPALARYPGKIQPHTTSKELVSTLDVVPTIMSIIGREKKIPDGLDGIDVSDVFYGRPSPERERMLFYWRDGFQDGPLPAPYGRFDVAAVRHGRFKAWFYTKSAHYNDDIEQHHDPPLLFDVMTDPAESSPLDPTKHQLVLETIRDATQQHKATVDWMMPLALATDNKYIPCVDPGTGCRTTTTTTEFVINNNDNNHDDVVVDDDDNINKKNSDNS